QCRGQKSGASPQSYLLRINRHAGLLACWTVAGAAVRRQTKLDTVLATDSAVALRPKLLLADEPTGNLDSATGAQIIELLVALNREHGSTLVLVTHDEALAARGQRIVALRDGRVVGAA